MSGAGSSWSSYRKRSNGTRESAMKSGAQGIYGPRKSNMRQVGHGGLNHVRHDLGTRSHPTKLPPHGSRRYRFRTERGADAVPGVRRDFRSASEPGFGDPLDVDAVPLDPLTHAAVVCSESLWE